MNLTIAIVCWFIASCITMSFIEYFVHRYVMHKRTLPRWLYRVVPGMWSVFENHAVLHHGRYYKVFNHEDDPKGRTISIRLDLWIAVVGGVLVGLALLPLSIVAGPVFLTVILLHHLAWNLIHEEMHNPRPRWFRRLPFYKFLARYHWMHHKYPGKNYNVILPGADFLFGKHVKPTAADRAQMHAIGI
jgi:Fatty acid hydroxylase